MALCRMFSELQWKIIILCQHETATFICFLHVPATDHSNKSKNRHNIPNDNIHSPEPTMLLVPKQTPRTKIITIKRAIKYKIK